MPAAQIEPPPEGDPLPVVRSVVGASRGFLVSALTRAILPTVFVVSMPGFSYLIASMIVAQVNIFSALVGFLYLSVMTWAFAAERNVRWFLHDVTTRQLAWQLPLAISTLTSVVAIAIVQFSALTCSLQDLRWLPVGPDGARDDCFQHFQRHYLWHFADSIPGLGITGTLRWQEPYVYADARTGAVLLAFKAAIILPSISALFTWRRLVKDRAQQLQGREARPDPI